MMELRALVQRPGRVLAVLLYLLLSGPGHALDPSSTLAQLHHTAWQADDGAPTNIVAMAQTTDGFLWLGTGSGLFRFDGVSFERMGSVSGQTALSNSISALHAMPTGELLIGHRHGGVSILDKDGLEHHTAADGLPTGNAWAFVVDGEGSIWGAFTGGIARLRAGVWRTFALDGESVPFRSMLIDPQSRIWVTARTGAYVLRKGAGAFERVDADLPSYPTLSLAPDGRVWAADFERLRIGGLVEDGARFRSVPDAEHMPFPPTGDRHWFDSHGGLWVRTGDGIVRIPRPSKDGAATPDAGRPSMESFGMAQGLTGDFNCLLEDREGNVWVGTAGGLHRFRHNNVRRVELGANDGGVGAAPAEGGSIWATTEFGGLFKVGDSVEAFPQVGQRASHIHRDRDGIVWIGSRNALWKIDGEGRATEVPRPDAGDSPQASAFAPIHAMAKDRSGVLWASLVVNGTYRRVGEQWVKVAPELGNVVMSMANDSDGRLWIGYTDGGAARVDGDEVRRFTPQNGLNIGAVMSIFGRSERVWLGGQRGVALYDGTVMRTLSFKGIDELTVVSGIVETASGQLWINAANGLTRIDAQEWQRALREPAYPVRAQRFDARDGLLDSASQIRPLPSLIEADDGKLWAAHPRGLFVIDPARLHRNGLAPAVIVRGLFADGQRVQTPAAPNPPRLPVGPTDVRIDYTATSLTAPERVRFRYKLEGYDKVWRDAGDRREAAYTQVGPGDYVFRVIAANNDGVWNEEGAVLAFSVPPAFWQTRWFAALAMALAGVLVWALYRLRVRQISARLRERMNERILERERIARELHDTLLQSVTGLTLHVRAAANQVPADSTLRSRLELALTRANEVIVEARDRVTELRVPSRRQVPLPEALSDACKELSDAFPGPACRLIVSGVERQISPLVVEEAGRIAREALTNALRHSGGRSIAVTLRFDRDALRMSVRDDGSGFDANSREVTDRPGHYGLSGMRERAARVGAQLQLRSGAGGTEVQLVVPAAAAYGPGRHGHRTDPRSTGPDSLT